MYGWIVAPLKPDLEEREIDNLVFILDVGLRSTPSPRSTVANNSSFKNTVLA
uniref:Uncharacterized protein n=1 Tax=Desertifilum tharense IPPAS B-1220 TaxID=1781255 RepID=A0ACD5GP78_9CYAN